MHSVIMMKYNFDEIIPRRGTNSVKWDETSIEDVIPLWVADMDFRTFPPIIEALHRRVDHGVFGYTHVPESYYESVISWFSKRHGLSGVVPADIIYTTGVVPAVSAIIRGLTLPGDKVLIQTPVYNCFFSSIRNQGCIVEESHLVYENNTYTVDWEDFERKCSDSRVRIFLLCNPHNPAGRVWTEEELRRMGEICLKYDVFVIADEIHCELVMPGHHYTPFASLSPEFLHNSATCVAPTKAFNIAGLQIASIIVEDSHKRERIDRAINLHEVCDVNPFGVIATEVAYTSRRITTIFVSSLPVSCRSSVWLSLRVLICLGWIARRSACHRQCWLSVYSQSMAFGSTTAKCMERKIDRLCVSILLVRVPCWLKGCNAWPVVSHLFRAHVYYNKV